MTNPADLTVPIDTLCVGLGERLRCRTRIGDCIDYRDWDERADDVAQIRAYVRAIRLLRKAQEGDGR